MSIQVVRSLKTAFVPLLLLGCFRVAWAQKPEAAKTDTKPVPDDKVVITVGKDRITVGDIKRIVAALPPDYRAYYAGPGKRDLPQYLVRMKVLVAEALEQHLESRPEVQQALEIARESVLADAARKQIEAKIPVTEQQLRELYEKRKQELEEVRIRHIVLRTKESVVPLPGAPARPPMPAEEARKKLEDIRKQVLAGADFGELARDYSEDLGTAGAGGDMGYVNRQKVVPPVADAAYALHTGQVSDIIVTPFGLEIIKLEDRRTKTLEEVKPALEAQIREQKFVDVLAEIQKKKYPMNLDFDYWGISFSYTVSHTKPGEEPKKQEEPKKP
jgi:peptidyl-prolyl cis-trans isomerase C